MTYTHGDEIEKECPKCQTLLVFELGFYDMWDYRTGHYTIDIPTLACPKCNYLEDYEVKE